MTINATVWTLTNKQTRWIERSARRVRQLDPRYSYMLAVQLAFDLLRAWPSMRPEKAADAFLRDDKRTLDRYALA